MSSGSGAWYTHDGKQLGHGRENAKAFQQDVPELMVEFSDFATICRRVPGRVS